MHNHMSHFSLKSLFGAVFLFFAFSIGLKAQDGAKIFKQNCAVCHSLTDQKLTGPGLLGVADRITSKPVEEWMAKWIKNNNKVIASGDAYASLKHGKSFSHTRHTIRGGRFGTTNKK